MHAAIPSAANHPLLACQAFTPGPGAASINVYVFTRGKLSDNVANLFIMDVGNGLRQLATYPSLRRHHHTHALLNDYRQWSLLQQFKTKSKRFRHIIIMVIINIVSGTL